MTEKNYINEFPSPFIFFIVYFVSFFINLLLRFLLLLFLIFVLVSNFSFVLHLIQARFSFKRQKQKIFFLCGHTVYTKVIVIRDHSLLPITSEVF